MFASGFVYDVVIMSFAILKINWQNLHIEFAIVQTFNTQDGA